MSAGYMRRRSYSCLSRGAAFDLMNILHDGILGNGHYFSRMPATCVDRIFAGQNERQQIFQVLFLSADNHSWMNLLLECDKISEFLDVEELQALSTHWAVDLVPYLLIHLFCNGLLEAKAADLHRMLTRGRW